MYCGSGGQPGPFILYGRTLFHVRFHVFNTAAAFDGERYVLLFETDDPAYPKFTFKFLESTDLKHWETVENAIYGQDKYVGGPAMYYLPDGYFYVTYVNSFHHPENGGENWETRIARSRDLIHWEEGSYPVISPDYSHRPDPRSTLPMRNFWKKTARPSFIATAATSRA